MVKFEKLQSVRQAEEYFRKDFTNDRENYYAKDGVRTVHGVFSGRLAAEMGLEGQCTREQYERLIAGQHPLTGEQLVANVEPRPYTNKWGEQAMTRGRVPGIDLNFAMPKSFSAQAIYGKDSRFYEWHQEAKAEALEHVEGYAMAHMGGSNPAERTGKLLIVEFDHTSARPVDGIASPHIHTHAIAINLQRTADGKWHALQNEEMMRVQRLEKEIYFAALAAKARRGGYETYVGEYGEPQIEGVSREWIEAVSLRRGTLEDQAEKIGINLSETGSHAALLNELAKCNRESKQAIDRDKTEFFMAQKNAEFGCGFEERTARALNRGQCLLAEQERQQAVGKAVDYARDHRLERSATVCEDHLYQDALERARGQGITFRDVIREVAQRKKSGEFLVRREARTTSVLTTRQEIEKEEQNIEIMRRGQGIMEPIARDPAQALREVSESAELRQAGIEYTPNEGQKRVFQQVLSCADQVQGVQGDAGTGKTYLLRGVRIAVEQQGYTVKGFGTTGRNTCQLGESGIEVETLQSHLQKGDQGHQGQGNVLYVIDESSLAGSKALNTFLSRLRPNERALLVGDTGQHQSVDAGKAFEQLQEAGMQTAHLDQIVRQKDELLLQIATDLAAHRTEDAFRKLEQGGFIHEIRDPKQRTQALTSDVLRYRDQARQQHPNDPSRQKFVLVTAQNDRKRELNQAIRRQMQARKEVSTAEHTIRVLEPRQDLTDAQKKWAAKYEAGDVLRYFKGSPTAGIRKDDYARVVATDPVNNTITVELQNGTGSGRRLSYDPSRRNGVEVFREGERAFAAGDVVQFTAKWAAREINRRDMGTVESIDAEGNLGIRLESGRQVRFNASEFRALEHGYCTTSHASQGLTAGFSAADFPTHGNNPDLINPRAFYVSVTRAMYGNGIYTDDLGRLKELFTRTLSNDTAIDAESYRRPPGMALEPLDEQLGKELARQAGSFGPPSLIDQLRQQMDQAAAQPAVVTSQAERSLVPSVTPSRDLEREIAEARHALIDSIIRQPPVPSSRIEEAATSQLKPSQKPAVQPRRSRGQDRGREIAKGFGMEL